MVIPLLALGFIGHRYFNRQRSGSSFDVKNIASKPNSECLGKTLMTEQEFLKAYQEAKAEVSKRGKDIRLQSMSLLRSKSANFIFKSYPEGDLVASLYYFQNKQDTDTDSQGNSGGWGGFQAITLENSRITPHQAFEIALNNGGSQYCQEFPEEPSQIRLQWYETKTPLYEVSFGDLAAKRYLEIKIDSSSGIVVDKIDQDNSY